MPSIYADEEEPVLDLDNEEEDPEEDPEMDLHEEEDDLEMDVDDEEEEEPLPASPPPLSPLRTPPPCRFCAPSSDTSASVVSSRYSKNQLRQDFGLLGCRVRILTRGKNHVAKKNKKNEFTPLLNTIADRVDATICSRTKQAVSANAAKVAEIAAAS
ncbi:hypothetical protein Tco_0241641 [Tanacetum coccineum]